jgi:hypothetical protein
MRLSSTNQARGAKSVERAFNGIPESAVSGIKSVLASKSQIRATAFEVDSILA